MRSDETIRSAVHEMEDYLSRFSGAGITEVRGGIAKWGAGPVNPVQHQFIPACDHLEAALKALRDSGEPSLAAAIALVSSQLRWTSYDAYSRAEIGEAFGGTHAFASLIAKEGPIVSHDFEFGLFVIAPNIFYRDRHHAAPELYAPLTGPHGWRFKPGDPLIWKPAHETVWNVPWQCHATMTGALPFLSLYAWTRDVAIDATVVAAADWDQLERHSQRIEPPAIPGE